jgi:hypothetical protein
VNRRPPKRVLATGLAVGLGLSARASIAAPATTAATADDAGSACSDASWAQGPKDAEVVLRLWIDPYTKGTGGGGPSQFAYEAWLALRDILVDRGSAHSFRLEVAVARRRTGGSDSSPEARSARLIFMALLETAGPNAVLRAMTRSSGFDLELATHRADARQALAKSVGVEDDELDTSPSAIQCRENSLDASRAYLDQRVGPRGAGFPMIEMRARGQRARFVQDANARGPEVRALLDQLTGVDSGTPRPSFTTPGGPRSIAPAPELARSYPGYGMLIGGPGLHHHLILLADDERSSVLNRSLPSVLRYLSHNPGQLSVQVLGVGSGSHAETFSRRMCAARNAGLQLPYLRYLSWSEARREELDPRLGEELDAIADSAGCPESELPELRQDPPGPESRGRRRGAPLSSLLQSRDLWLDGMPSTTSEIERLDSLLAAPRTHTGLWELMWKPYGDEL